MHKRLTIICDWTAIEDPRHPLHGRNLRIPVVCVRHQLINCSATIGPAYPDGTETAICVVDCTQPVAEAIANDNLIGVYELEASS